MEVSENLPLIFKCNLICVNDIHFWDEIIQLTFISIENEYVSFSRLAYEDEIYIEYNDQTNFIYANCKDVNFNITGFNLLIDMKPTRKMNMPNMIEIFLKQTIDNFEEIITVLKSTSKI